MLTGRGQWHTAGPERRGERSGHQPLTWIDRRQLLRRARHRLRLRAGQLRQFRRRQLRDPRPLIFDSTGLRAGVYSTAIDYSLFSRYSGFADRSLVTQRIVIRANVLAPVVAPAAEPVPEPATLGTMLLGFGIIGAAMRRQRMAVVLA